LSNSMLIISIHWTVIKDSDVPISTLHATRGSKIVKVRLISQSTGVNKSQITAVFNGVFH